MNVKRWMAWAVVGGVAVGSVVAGSCAIDERELGRSRIGSGDDSDAGAGLPRLEVKPSNIDLGWVTMGFAARARLSVHNAGAAPLATPTIAWSSGSDPDFVLIQNRCEADEIAPGQSCELRLQVVPSRTGTLQGKLQVQDNTSSAEVGVAALGMPAGSLILAPAAGSFEDFGSVLVGAVKEATFTLENPGSVNTGPLQLGINHPQLSLVAPEPGECTPMVTALEAGQACNVRLAFSPTERGIVDATLTLASESAGSVSLTLSGRGLVPGLIEASPLALDFEGVLLAQSARRSVTFSNGGDEAIELSGVSLEPPGGEGFTIHSSDCTGATLLDAGQVCRVEVEFRPPRTDEDMAAELIASQVGGAQPLSIPLRGVGLVPGSLELRPLTAGEENFGDVLVGQNVDHVFELVNPGAQPSGVLEWTVSEGFEVVPPIDPAECVAGSTSLVDGQTCSLHVQFSPQRRASASGSLLVTSALAGAVGLSLSGRGIIAGQLQAEPEVSFGRVLTAASASRSLVLSNVGDQPLSPPALVLSGADPAQVEAFAFQSECTEPLEPARECTVTLTFAPTLAVPHAATLELVAEPSAPTSVLLLGEALVPGSLVLAAAAGSSAEFGDVALGSSSRRSFTLTNPGAVPSGSLTITTDDKRFEVEPGDCTGGGPGGLVDGASCSFGIAFTPDDSLVAAASVTVQSPGAGRAGLELSGRGRKPAALSATGNRDMGRANIGQMALTVPENELTWAVSNSGDLSTGALVVVNDAPMEFEVRGDTCQGVELAGQAACELTIRFRALETGPRTGRVSVTDPAQMSSAAVVLTGLGVQRAGPGQSCVNAECETGECTPLGVCCDTACDHICEVCSSDGVCTPSSSREPCGNGAACFGVDQCKLPEGSACSAAGGDAQCGSGRCELRLGGVGDGDRICCLEDCPAGLGCNTEGRCEQPALGAGAACGGPADARCGGDLVCTPCVGSASGQNQCAPTGSCCGICPAGLECVDGTSCGCPIGVNGQRGIACADACAIRRENACCPEAPDCDPGEICDPGDHLCKQCLSNEDCTNVRTGSVPSCSPGGTCDYPCGPSFKDCNDGRCIPEAECCEDCQGRPCQGGTVCASAECAAGDRQCLGGIPQACGANGLFVNEEPCASGLQCQGAGLCRPLAGEPCAAGSCAEGLFCAPNAVCCNTACIGVCELCAPGVGQCLPLTSSAACPPVDCPAIDAACSSPPARALEALPEGQGPCADATSCATAAQVCRQPLAEGAACTNDAGQDGECRIDPNGNSIFCFVPEPEPAAPPPPVSCALSSGTSTLSSCVAGQVCCLSLDGSIGCQTLSGCPGGVYTVTCDEQADCGGGNVCCVDSPSLEAPRIECRPQAQCAAPSGQLCISSSFVDPFVCGEDTSLCVPMATTPAWARCLPPAP
jgi:hypothetical protein